MTETIHRAFRRLPAFEWAAILAVIAGYWLVLINMLRVDWAINPQYNYGWLVPAIAGGLFWRRWQTRPEPSDSKMISGLGLFLALGLALILPLRLVEEANPEWRMLYWIHAMVLAPLTLAAVYRVGGRVWMRHFAFPIFFALIMVPWPTRAESLLIQELMRQVAGWTVDLADVLGIPALQNGNVIQISTGQVGIDEACSGVRSLQTSIMVSLFLGEFYRMRPARRLLLAASSVLLVLLANLGRTTSLLWIAFHEGLKSMERWHDRIGGIAMWVALIGLWMLALLARGKTQRAVRTEVAAPRGNRFSPRLLAVVICWALFCEGFTEIWFRQRETLLVQNPAWSVRWPSGQSSYGDLKIPDMTRSMIRCDDIRGARWNDGDGNPWILYFMRWPPGKNSAQLAKGHNPEICLGSSGMRLIAPMVRETVEVNGVSLAFNHYVYEQNFSPLHVFYCLWEDRSLPSKESLAETGGARSRLMAAMAGKRHSGQQVLEVAVGGLNSATEAVELIKSGLKDIIFPQTGKSGGGSTN